MLGQYVGVISSLAEEKSDCVTLIVLCLALTVPWVGLQSLTMAFPVHSHLLFYHVIIRVNNTSETRAYKNAYLL